MNNLNTKSLKRVEIAKEVLLLLDSHQIKAQSGYYIRQPHYNDATENFYCEVCGVGALVVAALHETSDMSGDNASKVLMLLEPYFDFKQLALIEAAFEGNEHMEVIRSALNSGAALFTISGKNYDEYYDEYYADEDDFVRARRMFCRADGTFDYNENLIEIMRNIISHNGEFVIGD